MKRDDRLVHESLNHRYAPNRFKRATARRSGARNPASQSWQRYRLMRLKKTRIRSSPVACLIFRFADLHAGHTVLQAVAPALCRALVTRVPGGEAICLTYFYRVSAKYRQTQDKGNTDTENYATIVG